MNHRGLCCALNAIGIQMNRVCLCEASHSALHTQTHSLFASNSHIFAVYFVILLDVIFFMPSSSFICIHSHKGSHKDINTHTSGLLFDLHGGDPSSWNSEATVSSERPRLELRLSSESSSCLGSAECVCVCVLGTESSMCIIYRMCHRGSE